MRLPDSIRVGAQTYRVEVDPDIAAEADHLGECNHRQLTIKIDSGAAPQRQQQTLVHEALEAINCEYGICLAHEQINQLEGALYALLVQNPEVFTLGVVMKRRDHTEVLTASEFEHLKVCGTCREFECGMAEDYCDLAVPADCRDEHGVIDWELPPEAVKDVHDTCPAWDIW